MSLGRPAMRRKEEKQTMSKMKRHHLLMKKYIAKGMTPEEASKQAFLIVTNGRK